LQGNTDKKTFGEYLKVLGLEEKSEKLRPSQAKKLVKNGMKMAQRILRMKGKKRKK